MNLKKKAIGMKLGTKNQLLQRGMNSSFYTPADAINQSVQAQLEAIRNFKAPKTIDPSTVEVKKTMSDHEKAFMLAKKYRWQDLSWTLKNIWHKHKKKQMSPKDIQTVFTIVEEIKLRPKV